MAITKIRTVKSHLQECLNYAANPRKTEVFTGDGLERLLQYTQNEDKTEHQLYVTGFNCDPATALSSMMATKRRWGKDGEKKVMGYQIIQSFKPGEVTPEKAFEIGCEFARRYLAGKYECTVSTHLDRQHLHSHIVFNSVSFLDGTMFHNTFADYYQGIRRMSDDLCREYGLSVVETDGHGKPYWLWKDEKNGVPNIRTLIQQDMQTAMNRTTNWNAFLSEMRKMGYEVGNRAGTYTFCPPSGKRNIRMTSLAPEYQEQAIREYFAKRHYLHMGAEEQAPPRSRYEPLPERPVTRYRGRFPIHRRHKVTGFMALYYHYCYLLRRTKCGKGSKRYKYLLCDDLRKFNRYQKQCDYLWENHIQTDEELVSAKTAAEEQLAALTKERKKLYYKKEDDTNGLNKSDLSARIAGLTAQIKEVRETVTLCEQIQSDAEYIREQVHAARQIEIEEQQRKEREAHESRRRSR